MKERGARSDIYHEKKNVSTYSDNLQILLQGKRDNPIHEVAFNELIENLKERNTHLLGERSVNRTLFMDENSDRSH